MHYQSLYFVVCDPLWLWPQINIYSCPHAHQLRTVKANINLILLGIFVVKFLCIVIVTCEIFWESTMMMLFSVHKKDFTKTFLTHYAPTPTHIVLTWCDAHCTPKINGIQIFMFTVCISLLCLFAPRVVLY